MKSSLFLLMSSICLFMASCSKSEMPSPADCGESVGTSSTTRGSRPPHATYPHERRTGDTVREIKPYNTEPVKVKVPAVKG